MSWNLNKMSIQDEELEGQGDEFTELHLKDIQGRHTTQKTLQRNKMGMLLFCKPAFRVNGKWGS